MSKTPYLWHTRNMIITDRFCILSQCLQGSLWLSLSLHWHLWKKQTVLHCSWIEQWPTVTRCHMISPPSDSVSFHSGRKWSRMFWNLRTTGLLVDHNIQELVSRRSDLFSYITVSPSELHLFSSSHENYSEKLTRLAQIKAFWRSFSPEILYSDVTIVKESHWSPSGKTPDWNFSSFTGRLDGNIQHHDRACSFPITSLAKKLSK